MSDVGVLAAAYRLVRLSRTARGHGVNECSALLTNNVGDFMVIAKRWAGEGRSHHGLVLVSDRTIPRSRDTIGAYVRALEGVLDEYPDEDALIDRAIWLSGIGD